MFCINTMYNFLMEVCKNAGLNITENFKIVPLVKSQLLVEMSNNMILPASQNKLYFVTIQASQLYSGNYSMVDFMNTFTYPCAVSDNIQNPLFLKELYFNHNGSDDVCNIIGYEVYL